MCTSIHVTRWCWCELDLTIFVAWALCRRERPTQGERDVIVQKHSDYCTAWPPKPADQCKLLHMSKVPNHKWRILFFFSFVYKWACVCACLWNILVIFVSEGNLLKDLYNSTLQFWFMWGNKENLFLNTNTAIMS